MSGLSMEWHGTAGTEPLGSALAASDAAVAVLRGRDLVVEYANPTHRKLFGWPTGRRLRNGSAPAPARLAGLLAAVDRVLDTGAPTRADEILTDSGRMLSVVCSPAPTAAGPAGVLLVALDTTDQVRARQQAEQRTERMAVLDHATTAVTGDMDLHRELLALAHSVVPDLADACAIYLFDHPTRSGNPGDGAGVSHATRLACVTDPALGIPAPTPEVRLPAGRVVARAAASQQLVLAHGTDLDPTAWRESWLRALAPHTLVAVPFGHPEVTAVVSLAACGPRAAYRDSELSLIREITTRAGVAVDHALRLRNATEISLALQRDLLSDPPEVDWLDIAVRYRTAAPGLVVGGDWYDTLPLSGGGMGLAVGDVVGHDLYALRTMSQLRSMVRGLAGQPGTDPATVLTVLNRLIRSMRAGSLATAVYGRLCRDPAPAAGRPAGATLTWANCGHPPPLLLCPDNSVRTLDQAAAPMLGLTDRARDQARVQLPPGGVLLLYTDGLIEDAAQPSSDPIADLAAAAAAIGTGAGVDELCDRLVAAAPTGDDLALLAARVRP